MFQGRTLRFELVKSGEPLTVQNESALWGGRTAQEVMNAQADLLGRDLLGRDLLGRDLLRRGGDPGYDDVAVLLSPVLAGSLHCGDFQLDGQSFVGSRIAADKRLFSATGSDEWSNTQQEYHFDAMQLTINAAKAGLLGRQILPG